MLKSPGRAGIHSNPFLMKKIIIVCVALAITATSWSQNLKPVAQKVTDALNRGASFTRAELFNVNNATSKQSNQMRSTVTDATVLQFRKGDAQHIVAAKPGYLNFIIPVNAGNEIELQLYRSSIFTPDFTVVTSGNNGQPVPYSGGVHYWGIIKGDNASLAAISIFDNEVMGIISSAGQGNLVLGKIENDLAGNHILYNDRNLNTAPLTDCFTANDNGSYDELQLQNSNKVMSNCIRLFWEVDFDIYTGKGSVANAANYVTAVFNQSAIIYANDAIPVELSEVFVWNTTDPYTSTSTSGLLGQFQNYRNAINGDLGHLLGYAGGGGIAAGFSGFCASNLNSSQCYSGVQSSYNNVPTYSWTVMVVTHEQGHLMGSRHTHACVWNGNNTAIDGCGPAAGYGYEGSCSGAPIPPTGGTIMSYCHLNGVGINFNNGFGPQPKAVILNNYNSAACLTACLGTSCMPSANMSTTNVLTTTATFNWAAVTGATSYNIRYRIVGTSTWSTATSATTSYNATGLTSGGNYEWQVQTVCSGGSSIFTISMTFITTPLNCVPPTNLSATGITSSSATFNWTAASGATSYNVRYRIVGTSTWTTGTTSSTSFTASGLTASSNYEWQVQTACSGGGTSAFSSSVNFTTPAPPCNYPQNIFTTNITSTSATLNWNTVAGAVSYSVHYRIVGTTPWTTQSATGTSYNATGLTPASNYEWQIMTICTGGQSAFSFSSLFTTLCNPPTATIIPAGPTSVCAGGTVVLNANTGSGLNYQWLKNTLNISGATLNTYSATTSGIYSVLVTNASACSAVSAEVIVSIGQQAFISQPDSANGKDALIWTADAQGYDNENTNYGSSPTLLVHSWTTQSLADNARTLVQFNLNGIPANAAVQSAFLSLFNDPNTTWYSGQHQNYSGTNESNLKRITSTWTEPGVTWNTMPSFTNVNSVSVPASVSVHQDFLNLNVTSLVIDMINNPSSSYGFIMTLQNETPYKALVFASSDHPDLSKHPRLIVFYSVPETAIITPAGPTSFCAGGSVLLNANTGAGLSYQWKLNTATISGATNVSYTATASGSYNVVVTNSGGCSNTSAATIVTVNPLPTVSFSGLAASYNVSSPSATLTGSPTGGTFSGPGITGNIFNPSVAGVGGPYTIIYSYTNANGCTNASSQQTTVTNCAAPSQPGTISTSGGSAKVCPGDSRTYSIAAVSGATSYTWTPPAGASIVSGQGNTSVILNFTANFTASGSLSVVANSACGSSVARTLSISRNNPSTPSVISGSSNGVCAGTSGSYSVTNVAGITYNWTAPANASISSGQGTNSVTVNFSASFTSGTLKVTATNNCGTSSARTLSILSSPATPSTISGAGLGACPGTSGSYSVTNVAGAAYNWTAPANASISTGQGTNTVTVSFSGSFTSGTLSVTASNSCGTSVAQTLSILSKPGTPASITGAANSVCAGTSGTYSVTNVNGVTYSWTAPANASIASGQGTNSVSVNFSALFTTGPLTVSGTNSCGTSALRTLTIASVPAKPGTITGSGFNNCNTTGTYSVVPVLSATSYTWSTNIPGAVVTPNGNTASISFPQFTSGTVSVTANNACGSSAAKTLTVKGTPATPAAISGPASVCANQFGVPYSIAAIPNATSYTWTGMAGSHISDGVITSTGTTLTTTSTSVTVNFGGTAGTLNVKANNPCGAGSNKSLTIGFNCRESGNENTLAAAVFPNPSPGAFTIQFTNKPASPVKIEMTDVIGKVVETFETADESIVIDKSNIVAGIYYLTIKNKEGMLVKKISITK